MSDKTVKSKVFFHLCRLLGQDVMLWVFSEWDYMLPRPIIKDRVVGKPIYLTTLRNFRMPEPGHPTRESRKRKWYDLKIKLNNKGEEDINTDREIMNELSQFFGQDICANGQMIFSLASLPRDSVLESVGDMEERAEYIKCGKQEESVIAELSMITGVPVSNIGVTGSRILCMYDPEVSDYDLSLYCRYGEMALVKKRIMKHKEMPNYRQLLKYGGLHFPFKVTLDSGISVDLFLKPLEEQHPILTNVEYFKIIEENLLWNFKITSSFLSCDGWPTLEVDREPYILIIMCNGFRGVFNEGDVFSARTKIIRICYRYGTSRDAFVISDPFRDIQNVESFFAWNHEGANLG